ncbi:protein unc-50 homolog isoform X1 [Carya illinoinensis]|uniref:protein unc-50 homolog isoform X1 n=1 Tax=Carya illinoinensis TaxID=32201 RepID=UPI001C721B48|nr:protein unc-50 homolog isoform X1 [Carya illinoinensis]
MLPMVSRGRSSSSASRANPVFPQYLRRIVKWQQMDVEYTFWQMLHLCTSPKVVYQHTKYHKQTKNQWARDDPAFVVICSLLLMVATLAYCAAYDHSAAHAVYVVISVLLFHFIITGAVMATCYWFLTNSYLREEAPSNSHVVEQRVEWLYAFDVHCNSFFPMFVLLYVIHYFLSPLLVAHGFIPVLLSNFLFMVAASYYHYLNFLGYDVLPLPIKKFCSIALSGEDHFLSISNWCCYHPFPNFDFVWLQSFKILYELILQSTVMIHEG